MNAHKLRNKFFMVCTGKETENMFMMPIDTGNKAIKTENFEFNSGITMLADVPGENEEALMYQGRYYRLSHERNVYLPDKTMDDRYYLLTLLRLQRVGRNEPFKIIYTGRTNKHGPCCRTSTLVLSRTIQEVPRILLPGWENRSLCIYGKIIPSDFFKRICSYADVCRILVYGKRIKIIHLSESVDD